MGSNCLAVSALIGNGLGKLLSDDQDSVKTMKYAVTTQHPNAVEANKIRVQERNSNRRPDCQWDGVSRMKLAQPVAQTVEVVS